MNSVIVTDYGVMFAKIAERGGSRGRILGYSLRPFVLTQRSVEGRQLQPIAPR